MRGAFVIAGKDLRNIFFSPLFYVLTFLCAFLWSLRFGFVLSDFLRASRMSQGASVFGGPQAEGPNLHFSVVAGHVSMVNLLLIFVVAALTMRLFAEERRNRTFDLLLTSPVTSTEIMLGKLIAGVLTTWALIGVSFLYPATLAFFGRIDWALLFASYIGLFLIGALYTAVGIFASSLTQSTVVAVLMGLMFNIVLWFVGAAADIATTPTSRAVFEHVNVGTHLMNLIRGNVTIAAFVFLGSLAGLFAFLTQRVIESMRWR